MARHDRPAPPGSGKELALSLVGGGRSLPPSPTLTNKEQAATARGNGDPPTRERTRSLPRTGSTPGPRDPSASKLHRRERDATNRTRTSRTEQDDEDTSMTERLPSVCPECGGVYERDDNTAACPECKPSRTSRPNHYGRGSSTSRGYGYSWRKLSERARRLSPQCEDCGATDDLTTDHSAEAWRRHERGQVIRLCDVAVVCRRCNAERGAARGARADGHERWERPDLHQLADELDREDDEL